MSADSAWDRLEQDLADVLPGLEERTLTLSWSSAPVVYVQLEQTSTALTAWSGDDDVLPPERRLGPVGWADLEAAGWTVPGRDPAGRQTWSITLPWPARSSDYRALVAQCVAVLKDVHAVPSPDELEYRAWREADPDPEGVTFYPEDLEPAEPHLVLPGLGLRDAQEP